MFLQSYSVSIKEVMSKDIFVVKENEKLRNAVNFIYKNPKKEVLICNNKGNIVNIFTLTDTYNLIDNKSLDMSLKNVLCKKIISINANESLFNCRSIMLDNKIGRIPVVLNNKVIGIIREEHIRDYFYKGVEKGELSIKRIFDNIHEALCVVDNKGKVIIWNKNAEKLYGVKEEELKGKYLEDYFPNAIDLRICSSKKSVKNIYHSPKKGYHVIISASPIIVDEKLYGVVSTEKDITEIEELQRKLKMERQRVRILKKQIKKYSKDPFKRILGNSKKIQEKINISRQIAPSNVSVLITGESGTGKEEFAKAIHYYSGVSGKFIPVNCSAVPSQLFESEFFGYEKGAFTGAKKEGKIGFFELANNGTLFLDEIGDLPLTMQVKLLRVLQDKKIKKVGGEKYISVNVRIISATNKNLLELVKQNKFREELYYRINVVEINLPSLRERKEDIVLIIDYFLKQFCKENNKYVPLIDKEVMEKLLNYEWEGNIRQLKNVVQYMCIMCNDKIITKKFLPKYMFTSKFNDFFEIKDDFLDLNKSVKKLEINLIKKALEITNGNKLEASKLLNIPRTTLHSKLKKYGDI